MKKQEFLKYNQHAIQDKVVLDLACHDGQSTGIIQDLGAKYTYAVEARQELVDIAKSNVQGNVEFFVGDIQDDSLIAPLAEKSNTVIAIGVFYHLYNHFGFFGSILKPNVEHVILETIAGPETLNPEMFWGFEKANYKLNGWHKTAKFIPNGTPNLSWIVQSARIFGFECDWVHYYGTPEPKKRYQITIEEYLSIRDESWPDFETIISSKSLPEHILNDISAMLDTRDYKDSGSEKRVLLRLYNKDLVNAKPINLEDNYIWNPQ